MHYVLTKLAKNMTKQRQKHVAKFNRKLQKHHKFSVGDRVYLFNHTKQKLDDKWLEGFIIIKQNGPVSFVIKHQKRPKLMTFICNPYQILGQFLTQSMLAAELNILLSLTLTQMMIVLMLNECIVNKM